MNGLQKRAAGLSVAFATALLAANYVTAPVMDNVRLHSLSHGSLRKDIEDACLDRHVRSRSDAEVREKGGLAMVQEVLDCTNREVKMQVADIRESGKLKKAFRFDAVNGPFLATLGLGFALFGARHLRRASQRGTLGTAP